MDIGLALILGLGTGLVGGMMGLGGGMLLVPALVLLVGLDQHLAQGVSLSVVAITSLAGAVTHHRQGTLRLATVAWVAPAAVACGFIGASIATELDAAVLGKIFGVVLVAMSGLLLLGREAE